MTTPKAVTRWPEVGQFWAWRNPLSLTRIDVVGEINGGGPGCLNMHQWSPAGEDELIVLQLSSEHAEFLWWEQRMTPPDWPRQKPLQVGDILIARTGDNGHIDQNDGRLIFIGPDTDASCIHVLATWEVTEFDLKAPVYQQGPGHMATSGKTAYDHLLEGAL